MNHRLRSAGAAGVVLMALASRPPRLAAADELPTLASIIDRYIESIGGRAALSRSGAVILTGRCESTAPEESGPIEILVKTPNVVFNLGGGVLRMGFDGESVWRATASEGLQQRKGRRLAEMVTVFDPARALWWKDWYPDMAVRGVQKLGDREAWVLEAQTGNPATERLFIDRESNLLVRDEVAPGFAFTFSDYRARNGIRAAFVVQETAPNGVVYTYRFEKIDPVAVVDEARFQPK
jgi:hypothetical protein